MSKVCECGNVMVTPSPLVCPDCGRFTSAPIRWDNDEMLKEDWDRRKKAADNE